MAGITHSIAPNFLHYQLIKSWPGVELTELDMLVLSGLCLFGVQSGGIVLKAKDREYLQQGLHLSKQSMSNAINRLRELGLLTGGHGRYQLSQTLGPLSAIPADWKSFNVRYINSETNKHTYGTE